MTTTIDRVETEAPKVRRIGTGTHRAIAMKAFGATTDDRALDDAEWDAVLASKSDVLSRMAAEARIEHAQGKTKPIAP